MRLSPSHNKHRANAARLAGCVAVVASIWLVVLPFVASRPEIRSYIEHNKDVGIDPSAKFYTELPVMPQVYDRVEQVKRSNTAAFW